MRTDRLCGPPGFSIDFAAGCSRPGTLLSKISPNKARHLLRFDADVILGMHRWNLGTWP